MITDQDIEKMKGVFVTNDAFEEKIAQLATKQDLEDKFSKLMNVMDALTDKVDSYAQEMTIQGHQIDTHTKHIDQIANKLDLKLEY